MQLTVLTNSELSTFRTCPRKHYYTYTRRLRPVREALALRLGTMFHAVVEEHLKGEYNSKTPEKVLGFTPLDYDVGGLMALAMGYANHYDNADTAPELRVRKTLAVERVFEIPITRPGRNNMRGVRMSGKIDAIVELADGQVAVMEHKTTSDSIEPESDYWARLSVDSQIGLYVLGARKLGFNPTCILYNVAKKPALKPLRATPMENRKYKADGTLYANQRDRDETVDEYMLRVTEDILAEPAKYYQRRQIPRLERDLDELQHELAQQVEALRAMRLGGVPYRNPNACMTYGRCQYFDFCRNNDTDLMSLPDGWHIVDEKHGELK